MKSGTCRCLIDAGGDPLTPDIHPQTNVKSIFRISASVKETNLAPLYIFDDGLYHLHLHSEQRWDWK